MRKNLKKERSTAKKIHLTVTKFTMKSRESVALAIELGNLLNKEKTRVTKDKISWEKYSAKEFPQLHSKTRQRFMRLSHLTGETPSKSLLLLSLSVLYDLCSICGPDGIESFLIKNQIKLNFKLSSKSVKKFQISVNQLIRKGKNKEKPTSSSMVSKLISSWLTKLETRSKKNGFSLTPSQFSLVKEWNRLISNIISALEER